MAFGDETWFSPEGNDRRVFTFTHQPAYRPGERVEVKGIVRAYRDGHHHLDAAVRSVELRMLDPSGEIAASNVVPVRADLGTFDGGFDLLLGARTGAWKVVVVIEGDEYETPLKVDAYRKPAFEVTVRPADARILAGGKTSFELQAAFYDGGALAGAKVSWQLIHNRVDRELFPTDELVALFFGSERTAYEPKTLATGEGVLDGHGRLRVQVEAPKEAVDGWLSLRAVVTGPDRMAVAGSAGTAVSAAPLRVALESDKHLYGPEDVALVRVRVERADGQPAANQEGTLIITHDTSTTAPAQPGAAAPWSSRHTLRTDAQGHARVEVSLPREGRFRLRASVPVSKDGKDAVEAEVSIWAASDRPTIGLPPAHLEVIVDRTHFAAGDTARLLVRTPGNLPVLASLEGATLHRAEILRPQQGGALWSVKLEEAHAPNVFATFVLMDRGELRVETRMLRIPPARALLHAEIHADQETLEPGASTGLTIRLSDSEGKPVAGAEVALAVVDDALYGLHSDPAAPLAAFFHPMRRNAVSTAGLLHHDSAGYARRAAPPRKAPAGAGASCGSAAGGGRSGGGQYRGPGGSVPPGVREGSDPTPAAPPPPTGAPATPAPQPEPFPDLDVEEAEEEGGDSDGLPSGGIRLMKSNKAPGNAPLKARQDFRTCVFWAPALRTDEQGLVRIESVKFAESLTRWRIGLRVVDAKTRVGSATATVRTKKNVTARLTTPRFLIATDRAEMPLLLRNLTAESLTATWAAEALHGGTSTKQDGTLELAAGAGTSRFFEFVARQVGELVCRAEIRSAAGSDAEERRLPILPQGIERVTGHGVLSSDGRIETQIQVPEHAVPGSVRCQISLEPSTVSAVAGALPYLADYPHGCTEQTLSRFLPVVAAIEAAEALKVPLGGRLAELPAMAEAGVTRLTQLRHADGGFGWWPSDASTPEMTALVLRGLNRAIARVPKDSAAYALRKDAVRWLRAHQKSAGRSSTDLATRASIHLALAGARALPKDALADALGARQSGAADPLTLALNLRSASLAGKKELARILTHRLEALATHDGGGVHWALQRPGGNAEAPTSWREDPIQTTAEVAYALLEAGGDAKLLTGATRWLLLNRPGGSYWRSTRDTAAAVRFLAAHAAASGDLGVGTSIVARLNGEALGEVRLSRETLFSDASTLTLPPDMLQPGRTLSLSLEASRGTFSAGIQVSFFETGPAIQAGSNGLTVTRRWFVLEPVDGAQGVTWKRMPLTETVPSGALIECEIEIASDKPRDYLMVTDPHAAGFEPVREVGISAPGREAAAPAEIEGYDERTVFFVSRMPAGRITLRHTVRATHVGSFTALPAQAELMYFPDVRGNSAGEVLEITAAGPAGTRKGGAK